VGGIVLIDVGHRLETQGVKRIMEFLHAHDSFASLEEAAAAIAVHMPQRKNVRPQSLTRNLRQRTDGRWVWKHRLGRRIDEQVDLDDESVARANGQVVEGLDRDAATLRCPVLVLRGAASDVLSAQGAQEIVDLIPGARLEVVERAGHLAAGDNPQTTVAAIARFLDGLPRRD
jgi:pimeloyl-ACP methyl ester carboxylesterase